MVMSDEPTKAPPPSGEVEFMLNRWNSHVDSMVSGLERLVEKVKRSRQIDFSRERASRGVTRFAHAAHDIQHDVIWGVANLNLDSLLRIASECDEMERVGEDAKDDRLNRAMLLLREVESHLAALSLDTVAGRGAIGIKRAVVDMLEEVGIDG